MTTPTRLDVDAIPDHPGWVRVTLANTRARLFIDLAAATVRQLLDDEVPVPAGACGSCGCPTSEPAVLSCGQPERHEVTADAVPVVLSREVEAGGNVPAVRGARGDARVDRAALRATAEAVPPGPWSNLVTLTRDELVALLDEADADRAEVERLRARSTADHEGWKAAHGKQDRKRRYWKGRAEAAEAARDAAVADAANLRATLDRAVVHANEWQHLGSVNGTQAQRTMWECGQILRDALTVDREAFIEMRPAPVGTSLMHWKNGDVQHITGDDCPCQPTNLPHGDAFKVAVATIDRVKALPRRYGKDVAPLAQVVAAQDLDAALGRQR